MKNLIKKAQNDSVTMVLLLLVHLMFGFIIGIFASPVKKGMTIASNNTITNIENDDEEDED